jgi:hypothetical protein
MEFDGKARGPALMPDPKIAFSAFTLKAEINSELPAIKFLFLNTFVARIRIVDAEIVVRSVFVQHDSIIMDFAHEWQHLPREGLAGEADVLNPVFVLVSA